RARDAEPDGARLARDAAAGDRRQDVELVRRFRELQRLTNLRSQRLGREKLFERAMVDVDRPVAGTKKHTSGRRLPATGAVVLNSCPLSHVTRPHASLLSPAVSAPRADDPDRRT